MLDRSEFINNEREAKSVKDFYKKKLKRGELIRVNLQVQTKVVDTVQAERL